jgi:hypothetical protein
MKTPLLLIAIFLLLGTTAFSQANYQDQLFAACAHALPRLYEKKDFDSINYYIQQRWKPLRSPEASRRRYRPDPDVFCLTILLSIQRQQFSMTDFSDGDDPLNRQFIAALRAYANALDPFLQYKNPLPYHSHNGFDASAADRDLFGTTTRWATDLLHEGSPDSTATFLCQVFAGRIRYPDITLWQGSMAADQSPAGSPANPRPQGLFHASQDSLYRPRQRRFIGVGVLGTGVWIPGGHLGILGVHPSVDYGFGLRNRLNQFDGFASLRFVNAPNSYTIIRSDTAYSRNFYLGGYAGFDYTRYLVYRPRFEAGLIAGIGVDFFDVAGGGNNDSYLSPTELDAFNYNFGIRCNYFIRPRTFVGIACKYHFLQYHNPGGTPLDGNAFTIDFTIGINGRRF